MRAGHIMPAYPDLAHGHAGGVHYRELLRHLTGVGVECTAVSSRQFPDSPTEADDGGIRVRRFVFGAHAERLGEMRVTPLSAWRYRRACIAALREEAARAPMDLLHAHSPVPCGLIGMAAARRLGVPLVLTLHGSDILIHAHRGGSVRRATAWTLRRADRVIAVAEHLAEAARAFVPDLAVDVIPMGFDDAVFTPGAPAAERERWVVSTRSLYPLYSVETLVDAAQRLGGDGAVHIYGDGPERAALETRAADTAATFHGHGAPAELAAALQRAAVYVSTARSDGSSVSLLEALACGAYPVLADIPGNQAWVEDGVNGRLVPPGDADALADAIRDALGDPEARARAATLNQERVRTAAWSAVAPRVRDLYADLLAGGRACGC